MPLLSDWCTTCVMNWYIFVLLFAANLRRVSSFDFESLQSGIKYGMYLVNATQFFYDFVCAGSCFMETLWSLVKESILNRSSILFCVFRFILSTHSGRGNTHVTWALQLIQRKEKNMNKLLKITFFWGGCMPCIFWLICFFVSPFHI